MHYRNLRLNRNVLNQQRMKRIFICHPIKGDITRNIKKVCDIIKHIATTQPNTVPVAPYLSYLQALDDTNVKQRAIGLKWCLNHIDPSVIDQLHVYGDTISEGMLGEIKKAERLKIPVVYL